MKIFQLDIPEELRQVYEAVHLTDEGNIVLVFKEARGIRQINATDFGDFLACPVLCGRQLRIDTFAHGAIGTPTRIDVVADHFNRKRKP